MGRGVESHAAGIGHRPAGACETVLHGGQVAKGHIGTKVEVEVGGGTGLQAAT